MLRAISAWNLPAAAAPFPHAIGIIPIVVASSAAGIGVTEISQATGYAPWTGGVLSLPFLPPPEAKQLLTHVLQKVGIQESKSLCQLADQFSGWPLAFSFHFTALSSHVKLVRSTSPSSAAAPVHLADEDCRKIYHQLVRSFAEIYSTGRLAEARMTPEDVKQVIRIALTGMAVHAHWSRVHTNLSPKEFVSLILSRAARFCFLQVPRSFRFNDASLLDVVDEAYATLLRVPSPEQVRVQLPLIWMASTSLDLTLPPELLDPFSEGWQAQEKTAIAAMLIRMQALRETERRSVCTLAELRPGVFAHPNTAALRVCLPPSDSLQRLHSLPRFQLQNGTDMLPGTLTVGDSSEATVSVSTGGVFRAAEGQSRW